MAKRLWGALALGCVLVAFGPGTSPAQQIMPSTPDMSVGSASTADFVIPQTFRPNFVWLKNDCSTRLYFNFNPTPARATADYPLRLESGEIFTGPMRVVILGVKNEGGSACTFTLQGSR